MTNRLWLLTFFFFFTCRNTLRPLTHTKMLSVKNFLLNFNMFWKCFGWLKSFKSSKSYIKLNVYWQYTNLHHLVLTFRLLQMRTVYYHSGVQKHVLECWLHTEVGWLYWCSSYLVMHVKQPLKWSGHALIDGSWLFHRNCMDWLCFTSNFKPHSRLIVLLLFWTIEGFLWNCSRRLQSSLVSKVWPVF